MKCTYKNQTTGYTCGTTVMSMLTKHFLGIDVSDTQLFKSLELNPSLGTNSNDMVGYLFNVDIPYEVIKVEQIIENLINNKLIACLTSMRGSNIPHWILLTEYNKETKEITVYCPALGVYETSIDDISEMLQIKSWAGHSKEYIMEMMGDKRIIAC